MLGVNANLNVDMSDLQRVIDFLRGIMTQEQFERLLYRTFGEVGRKSKTIIARAVRQEYEAPYGWVQSNIGHYQLSMGGAMPVTCKIPLKGARGVIGPRFKASGGRRGRPLVASIVKGAKSRLPAVMEHQGGQPPFMNGGVAFTRKTSARLPIVRVVGLAVPQMPLNKSKPETEQQLLDYAGKRLEHNFYFMLGGGR